MALAEEATGRGSECVFLVPAISDTLRAFLVDSGSQLVDLQNDALATVETTAKRVGATTLIVDGYHFSPEFYASLRKAFRVVAIDDLGDRQLDVDFVVNQNPFAGGLAYEAGLDTRFLLGLDYALLRRRFRGLRDGLSVPEERVVHHIVVMMGGADTGRVTEQIIGALSQFGGKVSAVVGPACEHAESVLKAAERSAADVEVVLGPHDIAALIASADLGVVGAGGATWECATLGVPMVHIALAPNQVWVAEAAERAGMSRSLGAAEGLSRSSIARGLALVIADRALRLKMARAGWESVDGHGAARVLEALEAVDDVISLRRAGPQDEQRIWEINNDNEVRARSVSTDPIPWSDHREWFARVLADPQVRLSMIEVGEETCGVLRFDFHGRLASLSVALAPDARGRGLGTRAIRRAVLEVLESFEGLEGIIARIRPDNIASVAAFERVGFRRKSEVSTEAGPLIEYVLRRGSRR